MQYSTPISQIMTRKPRTVAPNDSLEAVRRIFEQQGFHHLPVMEAGRLVGIVSYTDYLRVVDETYHHASPQQRLDGNLLRQVSVRSAMSEDLVYLSPVDTLEDAVRVFQSDRFHAVPVVEGDRRLVGILSTHDLIKVLEKTLAPQIDYAI